MLRSSNDSELEPVQLEDRGTLSHSMGNLDVEATGTVFSTELYGGLRSYVGTERGKSS